jgi:transposase
MRSKRDCDWRKLGHQSLQTTRMQAVSVVNRGETVAVVAAAFGMKERIVYRWLAAVAEGGQGALKAKAIPGRPGQARGPASVLALKHGAPDKPAAASVGCALWSLRLLVEVIEHRLGIKLPRAAVGRAMAALSFARRRLAAVNSTAGHASAIRCWSSTGSTESARRFPPRLSGRGRGSPLPTRRHALGPPCRADFGADSLRAHDTHIRSAFWH